MERDQIVKALECCFIICYCNTCPYYKVGEHTQVCTRKMAQNALALIQELTEENERLHASCTELTQCCTKLETLYKIESKRVDTVRADTVRKMQEEARQMCFIVGDEEYVTLCDLDQIAKEMLEKEGDDA